MSSSILKRIEAIEAQIATSRSPTLCNVWTPSLAARIEKVLPPGSNVQLVHLHFSDSDQEEVFERDIRQDLPQRRGDSIDCLRVSYRRRSNGKRSAC
jgi:hypothetical protein